MTAEFPATQASSFSWLACFCHESLSRSCLRDRVSYKVPHALYMFATLYDVEARIPKLRGRLRPQRASKIRACQKVVSRIRGPMVSIRYHATAQVPRSEVQAYSYHYTILRISLMGSNVSCFQCGALEIQADCWQGVLEPSGLQVCRPRLQLQRTWKMPVPTVLSECR